MSRLVGVNSMLGSSVRTLEGEIGHLSGFYFDDASWHIRYVVVDVEGPTHAKVLLTPSVVEHVDERERFLRVCVTREQVKLSPGVDTDKPISLQHQAKLHEHFGWEAYWGDGSFVGNAQIDRWLEGEPANNDGTRYDPHLRAVDEVIGQAVQTTDGAGGVVSGFVLDVSDWTIHSLTVSLEEGKSYSLPPRLVPSLDIEKSLVLVGATVEEIRSLRAKPDETVAPDITT